MTATHSTMAAPELSMQLSIVCKVLVMRDCTSSGVVTCLQLYHLVIMIRAFPRCPNVERVVSIYEVSLFDRLRSVSMVPPNLHAPSAAKPKFVLGATLVPSRPNVLRGLALAGLDPLHCPAENKPAHSPPIDLFMMILTTV